jgi:hypothetical protein
MKLWKSGPAILEQFTYKGATAIMEAQAFTHFREEVLL